MQRPPKRGPHVGILDDLSAVHHRDAIRRLCDHAEIVRDEDDGHAHLALQLLEQLEDLRLNRHVQRRRRLVGDQHRRPARQRHGDHHALPHAAGQLVRILVDPLTGGRNTDALEHLDRARPRLPARHPFVEHERLDDLFAARVDGIQRGHRLLEDHRDFLAADRAHLLVGQRNEVAPLEQNPPLDDSAGRLRNQLQYRERRHALAAARFADHGQRFAGDSPRTTRRRRPG